MARQNHRLPLAWLLPHDVIRKVLGDLTAAGVDCDEEKVAEALRNKEIEARRQIIESTNL